MKDKVTALLLYSSSAALSIGFIFKNLFNISPDIPWAIGGLIGLVPSIKWVIDELKDRQMGSDVLAIFSIVDQVALGGEPGAENGTRDAHAVWIIRSSVVLYARFRHSHLMA